MRHHCKNRSSQFEILFVSIIPSPMRISILIILVFLSFFFYIKYYAFLSTAAMLHRPRLTPILFLIYYVKQRIDMSVPYDRQLLKSIVCIPTKDEVNECNGDQKSTQKKKLGETRIGQCQIIVVTKLVSFFVLNSLYFVVLITNIYYLLALSMSEGNRRQDRFFPPLHVLILIEL